MSMRKPHLLQKLGFVGFLTQACYANPFFDDHARGWHWYELLPQIDDPVEKKEEDKKTIAKTPTDVIKAYRQELEARLHRAWVDPTPQNLKAYQDIQKDLMTRSKTFATVWMQNVFQNPELDHTLISPVNQQARHVHLDLEKEHTRKVIQGLSETYGLFFFFSGNCPYCHQFAPIVKRFAEFYGWDVIPISVDGGTLAEFPKAEPAHGLVRAWKIPVLPALFAVNPKTQETIPIAYGLTSLDDMETRILTLLGAKS